jgi:hypothetical protein
MLVDGFVARSSDVLRPEVVRHETRSVPEFTVHVRSCAGEEVVVRAFDDREP